MGAATSPIKRKTEMEEKIKGIEVIAYKGIESKIACGGFEYEIGETYKTDKAELWKCGFHACLNPLHVLGYYSQEEGSRYYKVKLSGEITKCDFDDTEVAATEMTILEEINIKEAIKTTEWWKNDNVLDLLYWSDGFAEVQREDKLRNLINKQGEILSNEWFEWVGIFHDGLAQVRRGDKLYNFIDTKGRILSEQWFSDAYSFKDGFAKVQRTNGEKCKIDKNGKIVVRK